MRLLRGEAVATPDRAVVLKKLSADMADYGAAIGAQARVVEEIRFARSTEINRALVEQNSAILRSQLEAARALSAAVNASRRLRAAVLESGHEILPDILRQPPLDAALRLGSADQPDSQLSTFARTVSNIGATK